MGHEPNECVDAIGVTAIFFVMSGFIAGVSYLLMVFPK